MKGKLYIDGAYLGEVFDVTITPTDPHVEPQSPATFALPPPSEATRRFFALAFGTPDLRPAPASGPDRKRLESEQRRQALLGRKGRF